MFKKEEKKKEIKESVAEPKAKPAAAAAAAAADAIISAMPDALIVLDLNGVIVNVNPAMTKMFGFKLEERIGKSFNELGDSIEAEDIERFMKLLGELIETGHVEPIETVIRAKDGGEIPTSVTYSLIKDADGNPKNIVAVLRDITELKRVEEERARGAMVASTVDAMVDSVFVLDLEGRCVFANHAYSQMFGLEAEEFTGKPIMEIPGIEKQKPEEVEKFIPLIREAVEKGSAGPVEFVLVSIDGKEIPLSVAGGTIKDAQGNPTHIVAVLRDITEQKRAEEELKAKVEELEKFHDLTIGRELKMKKMEEEMEEMKKLREKQKRV